MSKHFQQSGIKEEPHDGAEICRPYDARLEVDEVLNTHDCVSQKFRNGSSFEALVADLDAGSVCPLKDQFLKLDVFHWEGRGYFSVNNRRLPCLKRHRENMRRYNPSHVVLILAKVFPLPTTFLKLIEDNPYYEKFIRSYSTRDQGKSVKVKGKGGILEVYFWPCPESKGAGNQAAGSRTVKKHIPSLGNKSDGKVHLQELRDKLKALHIKLSCPDGALRQRQPEDEVEPIEEMVGVGNVGPVCTRWYLKEVDLEGPATAISALEEGKTVIQLSADDDAPITLKFLPVRVQTLCRPCADPVQTLCRHCASKGIEHVK